MTEKWLARGDVQNAWDPGNGPFVRYFPYFAGAQSGLSWLGMTKPADRLLYAEPLPDGRTPYWTMRTIWALAEGKPAVTVAIEDLNILDVVVWFGGPKNVEPTIRRVAERARDIFSADLAIRPRVDVGRRARWCPSHREGLSTR
jgi:hypothetical protein